MGDPELAASTRIAGGARAAPPAPLSRLSPQATLAAREPDLWRSTSSTFTFTTSPSLSLSLTRSTRSFGDLRDVHEAVAARQDRDERAEVHEPHDLALVDPADFDVRRDQLDARRAPARPAAPSTDAILTVPSFSMSIVAPVSSVIARITEPPLPITSRIFSGSIFDRDDRRRPRRTSSRARRCQHLVHFPEDVQPAVALRLRQRASHDLGRDADDLDVHLQRRDAGRPCRPP